MAEVAAPGERSAGTLGGRPWVAPLAVAALTVPISGIHAVLGPGFVLDDWYTLRNAAFGGAWAAAGTAQQAARPGAAVTYWAVFGLVGRHPMATLAILAVVVAATAALLVVLLRTWFPDQIAVGAALLWVVLPNHLSLEVWASATNISLSVLLVVAGGVAMVRRGPWRFLAVPLLMAAALCYEAVLPVAAAMVVVGPWWLRRRPDLRLVVAVGAGLALVAGWIVAHWHPDKHLSEGFADLSQALPAHFGWGVAPGGPVATALLVVALVGVVVAGGRCALPSLRASVGPPEAAVVTGVAVIVLGTVPFARYPYAPLGAGDRFNFVSAVGGALVWAGVLAMAWAARRSVGAILAVALLTAALVARFERSLVWHRAGHDAMAIQRLAVETVPTPVGPVVLGPEPIQEGNVAAYVDPSNVAAALQLAYDDPSVEGTITFSMDEFLRQPATSRVDIRGVSTLRPDPG